MQTVRLFRAWPRLSARWAGFSNSAPRVVREDEIVLGDDGVTGEALLGEILALAVRAESAGLGIVDQTGVTPRARVLEADAVPGDVFHPPQDIRLDRGREIRVLLSNAWSMFCDQKCFMDAGAIKNTGAWLFPFFQAMHFSLALTITCPGRIFSLMSRASEGRGPVDFRTLEQRALGATPTWTVFDPVQSLLTSPEGGFNLLREGRMGFRSQSESVPGTVRYSKSLSLIEKGEMRLTETDTENDLV